MPRSLHPAHPSFFAERQQLRLRLRAKRRALTAAQQQAAAIKLCQQFQRLPRRQKQIDIGLYWPSDGEIDPSYVAHYCQARGAHLWLPVVTDVRGQLHFRPAPAKAFRWQRRSQHQRHWPSQRLRWGLREPITRPLKPAYQLDVLLMPLVGFSPEGGRLGMGGGFYDRALAAMKGRCKRPRTLGLAHSGQAISELPLATWDEPVDGVLTDSRYWPAARPH